MLMPFKPKKKEPGRPKQKRGRPRKSPETPAVTSPPRPKQTRFRGKARPEWEKLLQAMERFNKMTLDVFFKMGGEKMLLEELQKEGDDYKRQFLKELFAMNKKYYDVLIAKMRIEAEKTIAGQEEGHRGNIVFIIKGLYDEPAIDVTPAPATPVGPREFRTKGLEETEKLEQEKEDTTEPE
jgi:hypothetical protein